MLKEIIEDLRKTLYNIPPPSIEIVKDVSKGSTIEQKTENIFSIIPSIEPEKDDDSIKPKILNINDDSVKDRWSRYIGAMGLEAVEKQSKSSIFLSGAVSLGIEISKNIVLAGCQRLTLQDHRNATMIDLSGQFFLNKDDIGKNRATSSFTRLQQLNYYVNVEVITDPLNVEEESLLKL